MVTGRNESVLWVLTLHRQEECVLSITILRILGILELALVTRSFWEFLHL